MKFKSIYLFLLVIFFGVSARALAQEPKGAIEIFKPTSKAIDLPDVGIPVQIEVGESIVAKVFVTKKPAVNFKTKINGQVKLLFFSYEVDFSSATVPLYGKVINGSIYATQKDQIKGASSSFSGFFIPNNPSESTHICAINGTVAVTCEPMDVKLDRDYSITEIDEISIDSFKRELVYAGGSSKAITLLYREFKNDFARPAFSQELKYDINDDPIIGFKGARFEVLKAGNSGLSYKVIKPLQ
ncbi:hypothetical protein [Limnohabitans sp.]|uniref:hypothetical protein n=1 Tax=Limnohabitans sp. TaxID=1907725 RepID=UPI002FDCBC92